MKCATKFRLQGPLLIKIDAISAESETLLALKALVFYRFYQRAESECFHQQWKHYKIPIQAGNAEYFKRVKIMGSPLAFYE